MNTCIKCGCDDAYPSLPPCPTPVDCPNPQPCAEFFDAQCVMYTLKNITCGSNIVVAQDSSIAEALESIVLFFCTNSLNCIQSVTDNGAGGVYVNNADPLNPIISFTGIFVDGTLSGDGTFANPLSVIAGGVQSVTGLDTDNTDPLNPIVQIAVDGVTITGDGTPLNPLVSVADGVQSVTGLDTDNTDPLNPIVKIAVDGITITGLGTPASPLIATAGGGSITGSGTVNYLARWTPTGTQLGIGLVQDDNSTTSINGSLNTNYQLIVYNNTRSYTIAADNGTIGSSEQVGILGSSNGAGTGKNIGAYGSANSNSILNIGVNGVASGVSTTNIGGKFSSLGATNNYSLQLQDGTEGINRVLTDVTGNGDAHWVTPSSGSQFTYEIGEYVSSEGGVIVHRWLSSTPYGIPNLSATQNYIVMALTDLSVGAAWGLSGTDVPNCESTWDGFTNTANIITAGPAVGTAAQLCNVSALGGKTDWYLPALDELSMMYQNRFLININVGLTVGFSSLSYDNYWSSTEFNSVQAWYFTFGNGTGNSPTNKTVNTIAVRGVRRFNI